MTSGVVQVRLSGRGGQGIMLAGMLLAEAGMREGRHVVQTQSYGPEARLGAAKSDVVLSTREIAFPEVDVPDVLLCLSPDALMRYGAELAPDGLRLVEERARSGGEEPRALVLPFIDTAQRVEAVVAANVVALGAIVALTGIVKEDSVRAALVARVRAEHRAMNERALDAGIALGRSARLAVTR